MTQKPQGARFIRVGARAKELGIHRTTLYKWARGGRIHPPIQLAPKTSGWWEGDANFWIVEPSAQVGRKTK